MNADETHINVTAGTISRYDTCATRSWILGGSLVNDRRGVVEEGMSVPEVGRVVACRRRYARILGHSRTRPERFDTNLCQIGESPTLPEGLPVGGGSVADGLVIHERSAPTVP